MNEKTIRTLRRKVQEQRTQVKPVEPVSPKIEAYLSQRLEDQRAWYERKASFNKNRFLNIQKAIVILGASIPMIVIIFNLSIFSSLLPYQGLLCAMIATIIAILSMLDKTSNYQTNWYNYRVNEELLKKEHFLFEHQAGIYAQIHSQAEREKSLVERVENIIASDVARFVNQQENHKDAFANFDWDALLEEEES